MEHIYKFRIFPSLSQEEQIQETLAGAIRAYNYFLERFLLGRKPSGFAEIAQQFGRTESGMREDGTSDPAAVRDAAAAAFRDAAVFRAAEAMHRDAKRPRARSMEDEFRSFACTPDGIVVGDSIVQIPYLGEMPCAATRTGPVNVLSARIEQGASGIYKFAVSCSPVPPGAAGMQAHIGISVSCFEPADFEQELRRRRTKR